MLSGINLKFSVLATECELLCTKIKCTLNTYLHIHIILHDTSKYTSILYLEIQLDNNTSDIIRKIMQQSFVELLNNRRIR